MSRSLAGLRCNKRTARHWWLGWAYARGAWYNDAREYMYQADFNPFSECFRFFSSFACGGPWSGRHFYTRKERIDALERTKKRLQDEIAGSVLRLCWLNMQSALSGCRCGIAFHDGRIPRRSSRRSLPGL